MKPFEESDRYEYDLRPSDVVLDCGGYEGRFADEINRRYGCTVHVLEPVKKFYDGIERRFGANHPNVFVHNVGIAADGPTKTIFKIKGDMTGAHADQGEEVEVRLVGVVHFIEYFAPDGVALLKLNVEGSEFEVVEKLVESGAIKGVKNLQVQWHDVVPAAAERYAALQPELAKTHHLTFDHGWVWQSWAINK